MVKAIKYINLFVAISGFCMYYFGYAEVFAFMKRHYFVWDKLCWFIFSYIVYATSKGFLRYAYCALSAFLALRVIWGIADEMDSEIANADHVIMPVYAMLIIITFGLLTSAAEWIQYRRKVW